jgi:hypothetical protein
LESVELQDLRGENNEWLWWVQVQV